MSEFKVVTNNMSAEYGYRAGAKVLVSTKSGTNQFHGSLYEFLRNEKLDGTNFFANRAGAKKPTYRQNQYGGTIGGPIVKNKTFFFFKNTRARAFAWGRASSRPFPAWMCSTATSRSNPRSGATFMTR
ncbi:MAG: hypothetical protein R2748_03040 [Bryobacterales bacterium]